jgi:hypothetical protein
MSNKVDTFAENIVKYKWPLLLITGIITVFFWASTS